MAKISARGAYKLAEARRTRPATFGPDYMPGSEVTDVFVLCSDGRILYRTIYSGRGGTSAYRLIAKVRKEAGDKRGVFERFCARRDAELV